MLFFRGNKVLTSIYAYHCNLWTTVQINLHIHKYFLIGLLLVNLAFICMPVRLSLIDFFIEQIHRINIPLTRDSNYPITNRTNKIYIYRWKIEYTLILQVMTLVLIHLRGIKACQGQSKFCTRFTILYRTYSDLDKI